MPTADGICLPPAKDLDESKVALNLIDTACAACMHSSNERRASEQCLPEGLKCEQTSQTKQFHFANGSSDAGVEVCKTTPCNVSAIG